MQSSLFINDKIQKQSHDNLIDSYNQFLSEIREDVNEGETSEFLSDDFQIEFKTLIFSKELDTFSAKNFYWLNLIDSLVDTLFLIEEADYSPESIIEYFEASEFLGFIITQLEMDQAPEEVVSTIKDIQEFQIISFFYLQLSNRKWNPSGPVAYRPVPELGEGAHGLYLGKNNDFYPLPKDFNSSVLPIIKYNPLDKFLQIDLEGDILEIQSIEKESLILPDSPQLLVNNELSKHSEKDALIAKYLRANDIIKNLSPKLYQTLNTFTHFIIPLDAAELVSYSMKVLPKYSCINLFNRDLVDLVDDLLHENGHHYLNGLLEGEEELINEDDEKIFYSPWRRALRPVRGIYHAVLTFFWAYRLFKELAHSKQLSTYFSESEIEKIYFRLLEEEFMIASCKDDLEQAYVLGKITDYGKDFYVDILAEIDNDRQLCQKIEEKLTPSYQLQLDQLKTEVSQRKPLIVQ